MTSTSDSETTARTILPTECEIKFHKAELPILLILSSVSNLVATLTLVKLLKKLRSKNLWLLTLLAGNDLFSSLTLLICILTNTVTCDTFRTSIMCRILGWLGISSFGFSIYVLGVINFERMYMIVFPIHHYNHMTIMKLFALFLLGEIVSLTLIGLPLVKGGSPYIYYTDNRFCGFDWSPWGQENSAHAVLVLFNALYMIVIILFIAFCNAIVIVSLRRRRKRLGPWRSISINRALLTSQKFSLLTKVVGAFNCVCNLPFFVRLVIDYVNYDQSLQGVDDTITTLLLFSTPVVNPFLYLIFNKVYRRTLAESLRRLFHCHKLLTSRVQPRRVDLGQVMPISNNQIITSVTQNVGQTDQNSEIAMRYQQVTSHV